MQLKEKTITELLTAFKLKRIKINKTVNTIHIKHFHSLTTCHNLIYITSPWPISIKRQQYHLLYSEHFNKTTQRKILKSALHQHDKQDKTLMGLCAILQYYLPETTFCLFRNTCSDTELKVQCGKSIISIFPSIQTLKPTLSSNKLIVYHIKNISSFKAVRGYVVCTI